MICCQVLKDNDFLLWDSFVENSVNGVVFQKLDWIKFIAREQNLKLYPIGFFLKNKIVGILPLFVRKIGLFRVAASPFIVADTPYMGIAIDDQYMREALITMTEFQKKHGFHFLRILQQKDIAESVPTRYGFNIIQKKTHILDLNRSEKELWDGLDGRCRTAIRKAEKTGVRVMEVSDRGFIDIYYDMLEQLFRRQKMVNPNSRRFYMELWDRFPRSELIVLAAVYNGEYVAGAILCQHRGRVYYLDGVSKQEFNNLSPNNLVQWTAIKIMRNRGALYYDFVGSDIQRLAKFKESFGGNLIQYTCIERPSSPLVGFARANYTQYKLLLGKIRLKLGRAVYQ